MIQLINDTIQEALTKVKDAIIKEKKARNYELEEPDYTVALAIVLPQLLNKALAFSNVKLGGCFIHQSPRVTFNIPRVGETSCELGDLLVLLRKRTVDDIRYNAALLQLKKSDSNPVTLTNDGDLKQLHLYENWPEFIIKSINEKYDVFPKVVTQGALYCIIKRNPEFTLYMAEPMSTMEYSGEMTFGRFIRDAINWQTGRSISDETNKDNDEWSRLIWNLIQNVQNKVIHKGVFNRTNVGYKGHSKLSDDFLEFMLNSNENVDSTISDYVNHSRDDKMKKYFSNDSGAPTNEDRDIDDNEGVGISILFIDIDDRKEREER